MVFISVLKQSKAELGAYVHVLLASFCTVVYTATQ